MSAGRPWKVFVRDIGPTFSFATAERAHERASRLVAADGEAYAEVLVYPIGVEFGADLRRTVYRFDKPPRCERLDVASGRWILDETICERVGCSQSQSHISGFGNERKEKLCVEHTRERENAGAWSRSLDASTCPDCGGDCDSIMSAIERRIGATS